MTLKNHKSHPIHKEQKKQNGLQFCQKFKIRPMIISTPTIKVDNQFSKFRVKVKELKMQKFHIALQTTQTPKSEKQNNKMKNTGRPILKCSQGRTKQKVENIQKKSQSQINLNKQDLSVYSLHQIISTMYSEGLMLKSYFSIFDNNFDESDQKKVLLSFQNKKNQKNFKQTLFTVIDHRIFAQCLTICCRNRYYIGQNFGNQGGQICNYYQQLYDKPLADYLEEWDTFNKDYHRTWMPKSTQLFTNMQYFRQKHPIS